MRTPGIQDAGGPTSGAKPAAGGTYSQGAKAGGEAGIPFVAKGKGEVGLEISGKQGSETKGTRPQANIAQVAREIAESDYTVFIDDFHYIPDHVRPDHHPSDLLQPQLRPPQRGQGDVPDAPDLGRA